MAWKKLLFSERTPYQLVEIYSTLDFGNVLVLDGFGFRSLEIEAIESHFDEIGAR